MAEQHVVSGGHADMDYVEHERTYRFFTGLVKYGIMVTVIVLLGMAFFLL